MQGSTSCNVIFQFNYRVDEGALQSFGNWSMEYDDPPETFNIDLSELAGKSVEFTWRWVAMGPAQAIRRSR